MWALVLAAPPKWTTSKAPGCTPKDPSGRDMGCSNNPSTLTFHKDPIPHVPQEFIQSPAGAWRHGLALLGSASPPPAPPPPPPGGLRHDADLSVMSADAFASDSARLAELSLQGAPPYAVGAMRLEATPVPLPAPAGTVDPKRQWGGAPDGAAPGEPFVDADGAQ